MPTRRAEETAQAAIDNFFSRFGLPLQIFCDQGRNFDGKLFETLCKALQIHKARTTLYRPAANGQVERFNRTLMDAVRWFIGKNQDQWDKYLQQIAMAIRASVNRSTGFTPNRLMLGQEVNTPANLMFPCPKSQSVDYGSYVNDLAENIQSAHDSARRNLKTSLKRMKKNYDLKILSRPYAKGDVYLLDIAVSKGQSRKLSAPWKGPAIIIKKLFSYIYRVKLQKSVFVVNSDRLMPCRDRTLPYWITKHKSFPKDSEIIPDSEKGTKSCVASPGVAA